MDMARRNLTGNPVRESQSAGLVISLVPGLRLPGLVAQKAFEHRPINAASFEEWMEKCLVPTFQKGDIVVINRSSSHKGPKVEQLIQKAGAPNCNICRLTAPR
jgi:hypothetical protein